MQQERRNWRVGVSLPQKTAPCSCVPICNLHVAQIYVGEVKRTANKVATLCRAPSRLSSTLRISVVYFSVAIISD